MKLGFGTGRLMLGAVLTGLSLVVVVQASGDVPTWQTISGGGGAASSDGQTVQTSFAQGQPAGRTTSPNYKLNAGYLSVTASPAEGEVPAFKLGSSVVASAGSGTSSAQFRLVSTLGQAQPVGAPSSAGFQLGSGFWSRLPGEAPAVPSFLLDRQVSGAAGGTAASDSFKMGATLGQGQSVGASASDTFELGAGFWPAVGAPAAVRRPGDLNGDGVLNALDLRIVTAAFGTSPPSDTRADLNGDGIVDVEDLVEVARRFSG